MFSEASRLTFARLWRERGDLKLTDFLAELTADCRRKGPRFTIDARHDSSFDIARSARGALRPLSHAARAHSRILGDRLARPAHPPQRQGGLLGLGISVSIGVFRLYRTAAVQRMLLGAFRLWLSGFRPVFAGGRLRFGFPPGPRRPFVRAPTGSSGVSLAAESRRHGKDVRKPDRLRV
jgi:hypothetical protein